MKKFYAEHVYSLDADDTLSVCRHDGTVSFSVVEYDYPSFRIEFLPEHRADLKELLRELDALAVKLESAA